MPQKIFLFHGGPVRIRLDQTIYSGGIEKRNGRAFSRLNAKKSRQGDFAYVRLCTRIPRETASGKGRVRWEYPYRRSRSRGRYSGR